MSNCELKPARVFEQFAKINEIPRPSKHEERMIEYLQEFGKSHGFETETDETGKRSNPQAGHKGSRERAYTHPAESYGHGLRQTRRRRL